jgi:hypothetical protein
MSTLSAADMGQVNKYTVQAARINHVLDWYLFCTICLYNFVCTWLQLPYFLACKMHRPIRHTLIFSWWMYFNLVIYWKKTGLLRTKISNHNIIYSSSKPRKSSLPLKSSSQLFSLDSSLIDVRVFISLEINTYPRRIRCSSNLGHIFQGKKCVL